MSESFSEFDVFRKPFAKCVSYSPENQAPLVFSSDALHGRDFLLVLSSIVRNSWSVMVVL